MLWIRFLLLWQRLVEALGTLFGYLFGRRKRRK
jgi:hypothetical protein